MNDDSALMSHYAPNRTLSRHVDEVLLVARLLMRRHSAGKRSDDNTFMETLVRCHDMGKATDAFQEYISNPRSYKGDRQAKAHTAISSLLAIHYAKQNGWPKLRVLALVQAILGHHSGFSSLEDMDSRLRAPEGDDSTALAEQWDTIDTVVLSEAVGIELPRDLPEPRKARRWIFRGASIENELARMSREQRIAFRLWVQFMFSILLEADKAFLAIDERQIHAYLDRKFTNLEPRIIDDYLNTLAGNIDNDIAKFRSALSAGILNRYNVLSEDNTNHRGRIMTLTLPTGAGKTLVAARWALSERRRRQALGLPAPRIIIALPYLSIIEQTSRVYRQILSIAESQGQSSLFLESHSISDRNYSTADCDEECSTNEFFIDTWQSEIVVTTFDQLLYAIFDGSSRHLMRFHALFDSLIILDEVQVMPCKLWDPVRAALCELTRNSSTDILMMTATQPGFINGIAELAGDSDDLPAIYSHFNRYRIKFNHRDTVTLDDFCRDLLSCAPEWIHNNEKVLITLNTRKSAKTVFQVLNEEYGDLTSVLLLSADITPKDRIDKIDKIADIDSKTPCIVVSTQCIEAGVDIDMDRVIRDFAPLDSIIQVAGRCNRNAGKNQGQVEVINLVDEGGTRFSRMIYDEILLASTVNVIAERPELEEKDVLGLVGAYYDELRRKKDLGQELSDKFSRWQPWEDGGIRTLLRGDHSRQHDFLIIDQSSRIDTELEEAYRAAVEIKDTWERRKRLRFLAGQLQLRTVSVYARYDFDPEDYATRIGSHWLLREEYYTAEAGLDFGDKREVARVCVF